MSRSAKMRLIGRREFVGIPFLGIARCEAKIDTGAYTSSLHCENITLCYENSMPILYFSVANTSAPGGPAQQFRYTDFDIKKIRNSFGEMEERFVIKTVMQIGRKKIRSSISLSNRDQMRYPVLVGRRLIKGKFIVDPAQIHTGGIPLKRAFKQLTKPMHL